MLPSDYKLAPPPTNAYQTDLALAAAANSMAPMPQVSLARTAFLLLYITLPPAVTLLCVPFATVLLLVCWLH